MVGMTDRALSVPLFIYARHIPNVDIVVVMYPPFPLSKLRSCLSYSGCRDCINLGLFAT